MDGSTEIPLIPIWLLLLDNNIGEFSFLYDKEYRISIRGVWRNDEYILYLSVYAMPYMSYGCNGFPTGMKSRSEIIRYYLMDFVNKMSFNTIEGLKDIISIIRKL